MKYNDGVPERPTKFRVWWIPQVPMRSFYVDVDTFEEGHKITQILANYDRFQYENNVKGDYSNAGGVQYFDDDVKEWFDYDPADFEESPL